MLAPVPRLLSTLMVEAPALIVVPVKACELFCRVVALPRMLRVPPLRVRAAEPRKFVGMASVVMSIARVPLLTVMPPFLFQPAPLFMVKVPVPTLIRAVLLLGDCPPKVVLVLSAPTCTITPVLLSRVKLPAMAPICRMPRRGPLAENRSITSDERRLGEVVIRRSEATYVDLVATATVGVINERPGKPAVVPI